MSELNESGRHEVEDRLMSRAANDPAFRRQLIDDPQGAIRDELGVSLPSEVKITVLQETPDQLYLVLPQTVEAAPSGELSDAELGAVAGGADWTSGPNTSTQYMVTADPACR